MKLIVSVLALIALALVALGAVLLASGDKLSEAQAVPTYAVSHAHLVEDGDGLGSLPESEWIVFGQAPLQEGATTALVRVSDGVVTLTLQSHNDNASLEAQTVFTSLDIEFWLPADSHQTTGDWPVNAYYVYVYQDGHIDVHLLADPNCGPSRLFRYAEGEVELVADYPAPPPCSY